MHFFQFVSCTTCFSLKIRQKQHFFIGPQVINDNCDMIGVIIANSYLAYFSVTKRVADDSSFFFCVGLALRFRLTRLACILSFQSWFLHITQIFFFTSMRLQETDLETKAKKEEKMKRQQQLINSTPMKKKQIYLLQKIYRRLMLIPRHLKTLILLQVAVVHLSSHN